MFASANSLCVLLALILMDTQGEDSRPSTNKRQGVGTEAGNFLAQKFPGPAESETSNLKSDSCSEISSGKTVFSSRMQGDDMPFCRLVHWVYFFYITLSLSGSKSIFLQRVSVLTPPP